MERLSSAVRLDLRPGELGPLEGASLSFHLPAGMCSEYSRLGQWRIA